MVKTRTSIARSCAEKRGIDPDNLAKKIRGGGKLTSAEKAAVREYWKKTVNL